MPLWLIISLLGLGTYFVGTSAASAAAAAAGAAPLPPPRTFTVGTSGADWYADQSASSSSATDMGTDMSSSATDMISSSLSSSGTTVSISTTVGGQIPAGTVLTALDAAEISVTATPSITSANYSQALQNLGQGQGGRQGGMTLLPVIKVLYNGQYVWVNRNEVF